MKKKYFGAFLIPFILFIICNLIDGNDFNFICKMMDVKSQYIPLIKYLKGILSLKNSVFFSFSKGLGGSMWTTYFYYLSSPLHLFVMLFDNLKTFLFFIISIKIGLSGLTMYIYLNSLYKKNTHYNFIFSMCYALMGYNICYFSNYFWLDVIYILPIVMLGIEKIINEDKIKLYIFSLSYAIFCNFYLSFSLCIFCVIYYIYRLLICEQENKTKSIKKFVFSSFIVGGICSVILLPIFLEMLDFNRLASEDKFNASVISILGMLYKFLIGSSDVILQNVIFDDYPNLYVSTLAFLLNVLFFFNRKIYFKEKIVVGFIYLFFISSMLIKPVYLFWHGFSYTNDLFYRFSYLWSFFEIIVAYKSLLKINYFTNKKKLVYFIFVTYFLCIVMVYLVKLIPFYNKGWEIILSIIFIMIYLFIIFHRNRSFYLIIIVFIELFVNCCISLKFEKEIISNDDNIINDNLSYKYVCNFIKKNSEKNKFIRISDKYFNYSLWCTYGSVSSYLSTSNKNSFIFYNYTNGFVSDNYFYGLDNTLLVDSILGVKYFVNDKEINMNDYALSIGYMINYKKISFKSNRLEYQTKLLNSMVDLDLNYFEEIYPIEQSENNIHFNSNDKYKYLYLKSKKYNIKNAKIIINNKQFIFNYNVYKIPYGENDTIILYDKKVLDDIKLYKINLYNFEKAINILKEQQLKIKRINKNTLEGSINVKKDKQHLFLSIPYEKGWNIYVDGKKVKYQKLFDTFIGVKLLKGKHDIKMVFYPPGLNYGILISTFSIMILIFYFKFYYKK